MFNKSNDINRYHSFSILITYFSSIFSFLTLPYNMELTNNMNTDGCINNNSFEKLINKYVIIVLMSSAPI